jgi:hypothetical protein
VADTSFRGLHVVVIDIYLKISGLHHY